MTISEIENTWKRTTNWFKKKKSPCCLSALNDTAIKRLTMESLTKDLNIGSHIHWQCFWNKHIGVGWKQAGEENTGSKWEREGESETKRWKDGTRGKKDALHARMEGYVHWLEQFMIVYQVAKCICDHFSIFFFYLEETYICDLGETAICIK